LALHAPALAGADGATPQLVLTMRLH
jgi:hypothetical protein